MVVAGHYLVFERAFWKRTPCSPRSALRAPAYDIHQQRSFSQLRVFRTCVFPFGQCNS